MNFTQTDYYKAIHPSIPSSNDFEQLVHSDTAPSITFTEFGQLNPKVPSRIRETFLCFASVARALYHLFYATIIGLPSDYVLFKTHIFLTNWKKMKFNFADTYAHALTTIKPLKGAFLQQKQRFVFESQLLFTQQPTQAITFSPPPPPPPPPPCIAPPPSAVILRRKSSKIPPPVHAPAADTSLGDPTKLKGKDFIRSMHQKLSQIEMKSPIAK